MAMEPNRRFSLLTFPQYFDGTSLTVRIVFLPRNQNPLKPAIEQHDPPIPPEPLIPDAPPFAQAQLKFECKIISGLGRFPNDRLANDTRPLVTGSAPLAADLFTALAKNFDIENLSQTNENLDGNLDSVKRLSPAVKAGDSVQKYLPLSYRQAFNFTTPRTDNAKTDDSYQCAVREADKTPSFQRSGDSISWGKVFAFAMRQPLLAQQLGMIYESTILINAADFPQGGWLYVDLANESDYKLQQQADDTFIKKYAARIPTLILNQPRAVFASILFPVLIKATATDPDPVPDGVYDQVLIEAAAFDDGFAKIVHAFQPRSRNLLAEESDGAHPVKEVGIRLGWDDEQILIWTMRQMMIDPTVTDADQRLDAPLGVFGYAIDVRDGQNPANPWEPLTKVSSRGSLSVPRDKTPNARTIDLGQFEGELPYQVYPMQLDGEASKNYWLPMYFASWNGHSMVLPDEEAAAVYQTNNPKVKPEPASTGIGVSGPAVNKLNKIYAAFPPTAGLRYGERYEFRVRLRDLSGGGPALSPAIVPIHKTQSSVAKCHFKRFVAPNQVRCEGLAVNTDELSPLTKLKLRRPLLGYPAVAYTGKYADPIGRLKAASVAMAGKEAFGIADPDVDRVEIAVAVQTLRMDNLLSISGKDNYVPLYTTTRAFPHANTESDYEAALTIPIRYRDCDVLHTGDDVDLIADLQLPDEIDKLAEIVLPTARAIRLTVRAVCEDKAPNSDYYGLLNENDHEMDIRFGQILHVAAYQRSSDETQLFAVSGNVPELQGIFLQPDPTTVTDGTLTSLLVGKEVQQVPDMIQRLAGELDIKSAGLTLMAPQGVRAQFGCSNRIRHTLSPESSSLTFASKGDLMNHWLCCLCVTLNRDWMWDALEDRSFVVTRTMRFSADDPNSEAETVEVGAIELRHTASFEALQGAQRDHTRLIFIDAVEPKNHRVRPSPNETETRFPDTIQVSYSIEVRYKPGHGTQRDQPALYSIALPITTPPAQMPRIVSAGIALTPYVRDAKYASTEPRRRFLWIEFEEPVKDPNDTYFARVLASTPDQLISNNHPELFIAPWEPALPVDPEYIRTIVPGSSNDLAGLNAMQPMQKATDSDRHYLLPLPPGLHANAAEMFGFFTYEFRVGHYRNKDTQEMIWSTAQGRFGRPLRATGIQHPAPTLTCLVNRDQEKLYVSAPYAIAVSNGKNVTADPPRTQLWCLLYAQVRQADGEDYRNVLLDDKPLDWRVQVDWLSRYDDQEQLLLKNIPINNWKDELNYARFSHVYKLVDRATLNVDAQKFGTGVWSNGEVGQLLESYGLPPDLPLSVLVVEFLPAITRLHDHISGIDRKKVMDGLKSYLGMAEIAGQLGGIARQISRERTFDNPPSPLSDELGQHRILRTSALTAVPAIC